MKHYRLSAIRLVGFHNYDDVLIRVRGDLFVVGANESGKTTILDAVHLVTVP
jgi:predicted ATP-dependent endonuclease of OLD family